MPKNVEPEKPAPKEKRGKTKQTRKLGRENVHETSSVQLPPSTRFFLDASKTAQRSLYEGDAQSSQEMLRGHLWRYFSSLSDNFKYNKWRKASRKDIEKAEIGFNKALEELKKDYDKYSIRDALRGIFSRADEISSRAVMGTPARSSGYKKKVRSNVGFEPDVVEWLKTKAKSDQHFSHVNSILRALMEAEFKEAEKVISEGEPKPPH